MISLFGLLITAYVGISFVNNLGKNIPVLELMLLIAGLQWIVGPYIEYYTPTLHHRYYMYVNEAEYMALVVPAYTFFSVFILVGLKKKQRVVIPIEQLKAYKNYGLTIFLTGVFFDVISGSLPGSLGFFAFIIANFKYAGAIILYFSDSRQLRNVFYGALLYLFVSALRKAMFHDLVLWSVFFYMFWALKFKPSKRQIYLTILAGVVSLSTLQTIKAAYRMQIWNGYSGNKLELFTSLISQVLFSEVNSNSDLNGDLNNVRLNQGWIISAVIDQVPRRVDFANGATITEAISASLLPRFLNPNKKKAGGRENFEKFTGLKLGESTSMGISIMGEAYANFGVLGSIVFMMIWAYFLVKIWVWLLSKLKTNVLLLAFLPIMFLQVVKAETELVVVLNHLIKSMIVVFGFFWAVKRFLNWNLSLETSN